MLGKNEMKPLEIFNFSSKNFHYFEALNATFYDSENIISKKYKSIKNDSNYNNVDENLLEEAHKSLLNSKVRLEYMRYLMFEYTLSQPNNINNLTENYYSIVFPYYLFLLRSESNEELNYLILDNINFLIHIYEKNNQKHSFGIDSVSDVNVSLNQIELKIVNSKENIQIIPYIHQNKELIYTLIIYMAAIKRKRENYRKELKKVNEINQNLKNENIKTIDEKDFGKTFLFNQFDISKLKILSNDSFVPKGIIFSTYISLEYNKNSNDKFLLLGRRYIYLFNSELLKEFNMIIPIAAGFTIFDLSEAYQKIRIIFGNKDIIIYIYQKENYNEFKNKLIEILEGNKEDIVNQDIIYKCSKTFLEDKIMGGEFENAPIYEKNQKDIKVLSDKLEELKKIKSEIEKEYQMNEKIRQRIEEAEKDLI
jgi:hypothetical protein